VSSYRRFGLLLFTAVLAVLAAERPQAASALVERARKAEAKGDRVRAYQLYSQAAAEAPTDASIWSRLRDLRNSLPSAATRVSLPDAPAVDAPGMGGGSISAKDLEEANRLAGPIILTAAKPGARNFHLKGDLKKLWEDVSSEFGLLVIFERDLSNQPPAQAAIRFDIEGADYKSALHALARATNTFPTAVTDRVVLVAQDNVQKRTEYEQTVVRVFPIPDRTSVQEAQEISQAIQQTLEMRRIAVDQQKRQILVRDRLSKVELAEMLLSELSQAKPQVEIEMELLAANNSSSRSLGLTLPNSTALVNFSKTLANVSYDRPASFLNFLTFGGGATFLGLGLGNAQLLASYTKSETQTILKTMLVVSDGQAATLHIGDKYPIITSQYSSGATSGVNPPPVVNFEELGLVLKVTPFVHGLDEVTMVAADSMAFR
jgi:general secretion pathway protein D